jgi:hypothetical protein
MTAACVLVGEVGAHSGRSRRGWGQAGQTPATYAVRKRTPCRSRLPRVDPEAAERDAEVREPGERRLPRRPVEPVPVGDELAEVARSVPSDHPASSGWSGQRVAPSHARRSSSAAGAVCGVIGAGRSVRHRRILRARRLTRPCAPRCPSRTSSPPRRGSARGGGFLQPGAISRNSARAPAVPRPGGGQASSPRLSLSRPRDQRPLRNGIVFNRVNSRTCSVMARSTGRRSILVAP